MPEIQVRGSTAMERQIKLPGLPRMFRQYQQRETIHFGTRGEMSNNGGPFGPLWPELQKRLDDPILCCFV